MIRVIIMYIRKNRRFTIAVPSIDYLLNPVEKYRHLLESFGVNR